MVDLGPQGSMPHQLERYWLHGKGALKIRWGMPSDWYRCVNQFRRLKVREAKGVCTNLHKKALGVYPGQERGHKLSLEDQHAQALLAAAPLGELRWLGPLAPIGKPTGDGRQFAPGSLSFRTFPLPLSWVKAESGGHQGRMTVGRILGATIGPDESGQEYAWGFGDFFNPAVIPEVIQALELIRGGVAGISLDPGGYVQVGMAADDPGKRIFTSYKAGGATLVSIPAFEDQYVLLGGPDDTYADDDDTDEYLMMADHVDLEEEEPQDGEGVRLASDCGCDSELAVNAGGWRGLPLADRKMSVDKDDAARRIAAWANGDTSKLNQAFLWRHPEGDPHSVNSYRLPVGDIIGGKLTLIYHAIYAASALLEGAHGGLPNIPDGEKDRLRRVISAIYKHMATQFGDPTIKASWDRDKKRDNGVTPVEAKDGDKGDFTMPLTELAAEILVGEEDGQLSVNASGWSSMPLVQAGRSWDEGAARAALNEWAGDDLAKYGRAFLWRGDTKSDMKFPIAMPVDGTLTIFPRAVSAALGRLDQGDIPDEAKARIRAILTNIQRRDPRNNTEDEHTIVASAGPLVPPASWFGWQDIKTDPGLTITPEGQVFGYLAPWKQCHMSVGRGRCMKAPKSKTGYQFFHLGSVEVDNPLTPNQNMVKVGRLTVGGGHADVSLGVMPTIEHYDNAGSTVAVVRAYEDQFGIQVAGAIVPTATPEQVAMLRRSPLSGDWRAVGGNLELVAALAVNVPGFPVFAEDEDGHELAMISAGFASDADMGDHVHVDVDAHTDEELGVDADEVAEKVINILDERKAQQDRAQALADAQKFHTDTEQARRAEILRNIVGAK